MKSVDIDKRIKKLVTPDITPIVPELKRLFYDEVSGVFDKQGRVDAKPSWVALSPTTVRKRLQLGYGASPILERSGFLKEFVADSDLRIINKEKGLFRFAIRSSVKKPVISPFRQRKPGGGQKYKPVPVSLIAAVHHFGLPKVKGAIPARPFFFLTKRFKKEAGKLFTKLIREQKRKQKNNA